MSILLKNKGQWAITLSLARKLCPLVGLSVYAVGQAAEFYKTNPTTEFLGLKEDSSAKGVAKKAESGCSEVFGPTDGFGIGYRERFTGNFQTFRVFIDVLPGTCLVSGDQREDCPHGFGGMTLLQ